MNCVLSFISGCAIGIELIGAEDNPEGYSMLVVDVFIIRIIFMF